MTTNIPTRHSRSSTLQNQNNFATQGALSLDQAVSHIGQQTIAATAHSSLRREERSTPSITALSNISLQAPADLS